MFRNSNSQPFETMNIASSVPRTSRRSFLQSAAAVGLATPWLTSRATDRAPSPNGRLHLGLIGCGGMGRANLNECAKYPDVAVTAACDVWKSRRDAVVAQFPKTCKPYADYREMLRSPEVDAVIIATPPHWHALMAIHACEAGKDLYLQKPMTLHLGESLAVRNAVRRHQRICQVGTQIHASENYRRVVEFVRAGRLGTLGTVRTFNVMNQGPEGIGHTAETAPPQDLDWDLWCGPAPRRSFHPRLVQDAYHHCSWMDYSGGWTPGMAPHIIDLPIWALELGFPEVTSSSGGRFVVQDDGDAYDQHEVLWRYPKLTLTWMSSITNSFDFLSREDAPSSRRLGIVFQGSNGTMVADYDRFRIMAEGDRMKGASPPPHSLAPSPGHEREWLDSIQSRRPPSCSPDYHVKVDVPITLSLLSLKLGRSIRFDAATERIVDDPEATRMSMPRYREPWKFPTEYL
jgi:predicted dehydrogenase